jgi:hypothetical protein
MRRIDLTDTDVQELANLIDLAVKAKGLAVVTSAALLLAKIQAAPIIDETPAEPAPKPPAKPKK